MSLVALPVWSSEPLWRIGTMNRCVKPLWRISRRLMIEIRLLGRPAAKMEPLWRPSRGPAAKAEPLKCRGDDRQCRWKRAGLPRRPAMSLEVRSGDSWQKI